MLQLTPFGESASFVNIYPPGGVLLLLLKLLPRFFLEANLNAASCRMGTPSRHISPEGDAASNVSALLRSSAGSLFQRGPRFSCSLVADPRNITPSFPLKESLYSKIQTAHYLQKAFFITGICSVVWELVKDVSTDLFLNFCSLIYRAILNRIFPLTAPIQIGALSKQGAPSQHI